MNTSSPASEILQAYLGQTLNDSQWLKQIRKRMDSNQVYLAPESSLGGDPRSILVQGVGRANGNQEAVGKFSREIEKDIKSLLQEADQQISSHLRFFLLLGGLNVGLLLLLLILSFIDPSLLSGSLLYGFGTLGLLTLVGMYVRYQAYQKSLDRKTQKENERIRLKKLLLLLEIQHSHHTNLVDAQMLAHLLQ